MPLWTLLCALGHSHAGTEKGLPQTVPTRSTQLSKMFWYAEELRFPFTGTEGPRQPLKNNPIALSLLHQTLLSAQCSQAGNVLRVFVKPRPVSQTAR